MKYSIKNNLNLVPIDNIAEANLPRIIFAKLTKTSGSLYHQINSLITVPLRNECIKEMYTHSKLSK